MMMLIVFVTLVVAAEARNFSLPTVFAHGKVVACWLEGAHMVLRECDLRLCPVKAQSLVLVYVPDTPFD